MNPAVRVTHVGLCVRDLDRSRNFYEHALGFAFQRELRPPDAVTATLLQLEVPLGLTAVYLTSGDFVLELLRYERGAREPATARVFDDPGLTHLSLTVADLKATVERVEAAGGEVVEGTDVRLAVLIRDPDGQLLELVQARG